MDVNIVHVNNVNILIAGAGIGGLALAQRLLTTGMNVSIFERDAALEARFQGYRIGLRPAGVEALLECLPARLHPLFHATCGELEGPGMAFDEQLRQLARGPGLEADSTLVDRHVLRHLLLAGLTSRIHFGKSCAGFVDEGHVVRAIFDDGTEARGDVLVGADGASSRLRGALLPHAETVYGDIVGAIGRTPLEDRFAHLVPGAGTMIKGPSFTLMLGKMQFRVSPEEAAATLAPDVFLPQARSYLRWVMLMPPDHPVAKPGATASPEETRTLLLELMSGWHPDLRALIEMADTENSVIGRPKVMAAPLEPWPTGRVTLLGDAAHLSLASGGMGANMALVDAADLGRRLAAVTAGKERLLDALSAYEREMLIRGNAGVDFSKQAQARFVPRHLT